MCPRTSPGDQLRTAPQRRLLDTALRSANLRVCTGSAWLRHDQRASLPSARLVPSRAFLLVAGPMPTGTTVGQLFI